jgi:hypothetical protein
VALVSGGWWRWWWWFWFATTLFKEGSEVILFTSSHPVLMEMIFMGKYVHIEGRDREAIIVA